MSGDTFKRVLVAPDVYKCGCRWRRDPVFGDVLVECPIHKAAGKALLDKFERQRKKGR